MKEAKDDAKDLKSLGSGSTDYKYNGPSAAILETFPNPKPDRPYQIFLQFDEFTSLCPKTGQPDFAKVDVLYFPKEKCVETKSLKLYFFAWRNEGAFMERIANTILDHLKEVLEPKYIQVVMEFKPRGGIPLEVNAQWGVVPEPK